MIKNLTKRKTNHFSTLDIETRPNGEVLSICIYDGQECIHFKTWVEFYYFIEQNNNQKKFQKFIAHNGGRFDWISLIESLLDTFKDVQIIVQGSTIIFMEIRDFPKNVIFQDSVLVLLKGLKKLCDTFEVETPKKDIDITKIEWFYENDYPTYKEYLERDCISLYQVLEKAMDLFDIDFWPVTVASLSMYKFRSNFLKDNIFKPSLQSGEKDEFFSESYAGGRVECFKPGMYNRIYSYDVNSLYPYVMSFANVPLCLPFKTYEYHVRACGFYKIQFRQFNRSVPPVLWIKSKNGLEFVYEGSGIYYYREINLLTQVGGSFKLDFGYVFPTTKKIFKKFVDYHYEMRMKHKGKPLDFCFKIIMNSLYGKFAQRGKTKKLVKWDAETFLQNKDNVKWEPYVEEKGIFEIEEERIVAHRAVQIASIVTSLARIALYKYFLLYPKNLVYCDTDSIHLTCELPQKYLDKKQLGFLKQEAFGEKGIYIGRKQYIIGDKMKFKGIPIYSNLPHDDMSFNDYKDLLNNQIKKFHYNTFPSLKTVLKRNIKACKMMKLSRTIRKADYLTNFGKE
jgi:hypothetical protein